MKKPFKRSGDPAKDFDPKKVSQAAKTAAANKANQAESARAKPKPTERPKRLTPKPRALPQPRVTPNVVNEKSVKVAASDAVSDSDLLRLNKYIAQSGLCSRREADKMISDGLVTLNGKVTTELGQKVKRGDNVEVNGKKLSPEKKVYVLLNKPKDFITTTDDPEGRKTVMDLVKNAATERIFPVGRLDRNTTGLLLFTNDGELAEKLTHPAYEIKKIYQVDLDKPILKEHVEQIEQGVELEDGHVDVDELVVLDKNRMILGIEIHIGRNRIVRRLFENFGYDVKRLDRVMYGPLTKKDLPRGKWRHLDSSEIGILFGLKGKGKNAKKPPKSIGGDTKVVYDDGFGD
jgi:23S rRNA pseudouridine2605 synthase